MSLKENEVCLDSGVCPFCGEWNGEVLIGPRELQQKYQRVKALGETCVRDFLKEYGQQKLLRIEVDCRHCT